MPFEISAMSIDDLEEVLTLWRCTEGIGLNESDSPQQLSAYLARNPGLSLLARLKCSVVGAVLCGHDGRRGYLHHLAVAEGHRHRGLGTSLVRRCLAALESAGIQKCSIFVYAENEAGKMFWLHSGWRERSDLQLLQVSTGAGS